MSQATEAKRKRALKKISERSALVMRKRGRQEKLKQAQPVPKS